MKILLFSWFYPPIIGGVEVVAQKSVTAFRLLGHQIEIITSSLPESLSGQISNDPIHYLLEIHPLRKGTAGVQEMIDLFQPIIVNSGADLFYAHNLLLPLYPEVSIALLRIVKKLGIPFVEHAHTIPRSSDIFSELLEMPQGRLVCVSKFLQDSFFRFPQWIQKGQPVFAKDRVQVVPNPIDLSHFSPDPELRSAVREELGLTKKTVLVLFPSRLFDIDGSLSQAKRALLAIKAFAYAAHREPALRLLLLSPKGFSDEATSRSSKELLNRRIEELGVSGQIQIYPKSVQHLEMKKIYNAADICLIPSLESFGLCAAESMACGTPVVGLKAGGTREVVGTEGGLLVEDVENTDELLGKTLIKLARDPELREALGEGGRQKVNTRFSYPTWVNTVESICTDK